LSGGDGGAPSDRAETRSSRRGERATLASVLVAIASALVGGLQRFDAGQPRQGALMVAGAAVGAIILVVRRRARRRTAEGH